ncbi:hypothetical protein Y032_0867g2774 [Ancylostoma ceylanicum]|uniref:Uncharacterized protein n=1 Tax=Ancylostoma ceylanicum TaxID=53326 RepID=A0A016WAQ5_9BILA|nr:hypothetical protein Y032_0867g2774 [Ancylostoma ceylanicum]
MRKQCETRCETGNECTVFHASKARTSFPLKISHYCLCSFHICDVLSPYFSTSAPSRGFPRLLPSRSLQSYMQLFKQDRDRFDQTLPLKIWCHIAARIPEALI